MLKEAILNRIALHAKLEGDVNLRSNLADAIGYMEG
jgi:hypothetical protein